jgi:hypothetical protein
VDTISTAKDGRMFYRAIDPEGEDEARYRITGETLREVSGFRLGYWDNNLPDVPGTVLVNASVRASWAMLADFAGNRDALYQWAPAVMSQRMSRATQDRAGFETPYGDAIGISVSFNVGGRQLHVRQGLRATIDRALTAQSGPAIAEAQASFADDLAQMDELGLQPAGLGQVSPDAALTVGAQSDEVPVDREIREVYSATSDGSIFSLSLSNSRST